MSWHGQGDLNQLVEGEWADTAKVTLTNLVKVSELTQGDLQHLVESEWVDTANVTFADLIKVKVPFGFL